MFGTLIADVKLGREPNMINLSSLAAMQAF